MTPALPRILICGNSLLLAGLEASLRSAAGVQVLSWQVSQTCQLLGAAGAAVAVYDQAETDLGQLAAWLTACPDLTLLGLNAEHDRVHMVTGHSRAVTATGSSITRNGVTEFSQWAVGNNAGPTAVTLRDFRAAPGFDPVAWLRNLLRR